MVRVAVFARDASQAGDHVPPDTDVGENIAQGNSAGLQAILPGLR
jgi:hypothetical protein